MSRAEEDRGLEDDSQVSCTDLVEVAERDAIAFWIDDGTPIARYVDEYVIREVEGILDIPVAKLSSDEKEAAECAALCRRFKLSNGGEIVFVKHGVETTWKPSKIQEDDIRSLLQRYHDVMGEQEKR